MRSRRQTGIIARPMRGSRAWTKSRAGTEKMGKKPTAEAKKRARKKVRTARMKRRSCLKRNRQTGGRLGRQRTGTTLRMSQRPVTAKPSRSGTASSARTKVPMGNPVRPAGRTVRYVMRETSRNGQKNSRARRGVLRKTNRRRKADHTTRPFATIIQGRNRN